MTIMQKIESASCACDDPAIAGSLATVDDALGLIAAHANPVEGIDDVPLAQARGRVLAGPVHACAAVPPFDNAAMDGYAVDTATLRGNGPWRLKIADRIAAGQVSLAPLPYDHTMQIFTGAPLPRGADAVVMQEDVQRAGDTVILSRRAAPGAHIRRAGEDMTVGDCILPAGRLLTARDIAAAAAAGHTSLHVCRRLRVALLVTGDEVQGRARPLGPSEIRDVNTPALKAAISGAMLDLCAVETGADDRRSLGKQLARLAGEADLVVTTGGLSVGEEDHVKPALGDLDAQIVFSGVALKPGKPVSFGHVGQALWFGLPGNPLSALLTWHLLGTAVLHAMTGREGRPDTGLRPVILSQDLRHRPGRCELRLATLAGHDRQGRQTVTCAAATHSGRVSGLPAADGYILIPAEARTLPKGTQAGFQPW